MAGQNGFPELVYNLELKRNVLNPCLTIFLPLAVVAGLLFLMLMGATSQKDKASALGYNFLNMGRAVATLLFPTVLAQINLRTKVVTDGLLYVEYYYFAMDLMLLAVVVYTMAMALSAEGILQKNDALLAKVSFWPLLTGLFFAVTVLYLI